MTRCPYFKVAVIRAWTAHNASYSPGEEYSVPEFIALILKRGGYVEILGAEVNQSEQNHFVEPHNMVELQGDLWVR